MKTLNFKSKKFVVGKSVIVIKKFKCGSICVSDGEIGKIIGAKKYSYPDLGLFNIRVIDFKFTWFDISMGEKIAEEYMEIL